MKDIVIIGSGGFGAEVVQYIHDNQNSKEEFHYKIKGFVDVDNVSYEKYQYEYPLLGNDTYQVEKNDVFVVAIAGSERMARRKSIVQALLRKNAIFVNLMHHTCSISNGINIGQGNIIAPYVIIGPETKIGNFNVINYQSSIAHDSNIGDFNVLSPGTIITGGVKMHDENFFGTSASVLPYISIGSNNKIQSGVVLDKNIDSNLFVYNNTRNKSIFLGSTV